MAVGEAFLSVFLQVLFDRLASKHIVDFVRGHDVENDLKKLKKTLTKLEAFLNDAEDKQLKSKAVKAWLDELKDAAYDAEDVLDEFSTEALRRTLEAESNQNSSSQVWSLISTSLNPSTLLFDVEIDSKIKAITERFNELANERFELGLQEVAASGSSSIIRETSSVVDESGVYGRDVDKEKIIELLLKDEPKISVIPIVGMGGIGKTTLAQIVYNDPRVESHFDVQAWACVSEEFNVKRITKSILNSVSCAYSDFDDLNQAQLKVEATFSEKKFLIVLDDVWSKNYDDWDLLQKPFKVGAPGSKIIVTTRNRDVSLMMGTVDSHNMKNLTNDECWSVFVQHAFENRNLDAKPNLAKMGKKIVEKCKGLPLAAKTLGGLLRSKLEEDEWENILNSEIWELPEKEINILPALKMSYHHLPSHLKRCFAYCAILPKDYEFEEEELVLLWMAEGLVRQPFGRTRMEDVGAAYFCDLLTRSFFQVSSNNKSMFVMHDLINDLAQWVAGETCSRLEDKLEGRKQCKISKKARHSSYIASHYDGVRKFEALDEVKCLRTFLPLRNSRKENSFLTHNIPLNLVPKLKWLRVLSLSGYQITQLPNSIGDLKHLRYLNLSCNKITSLPESISNLYNLQVLILKDCHLLKKLPTTMENLINLRLLDISNANSTERMPLGVGKLTSLQKLSNFIVGNNRGSGIRGLMNLKCLRGTLCISSLENVIYAQDAREANLKDKQNLNVLTLKWSFKFDDSRNEEIENLVLEMLHPNEKLKELNIDFFGGTRFPSWVGNPSFSSMVLLRLDNCVKCTSLPPIGQLPSLRDLHIKRMDEVNSVGLEFYGKGCPKPFPSLETLSFPDMGEWNDWFHYGVDRQVQAFPCLRELSIERCPKLLGKLPDPIPSLEKIIIKGCQRLTISISSLPKLCNLSIEECQEMVHRSPVCLNSLKSVCLSNILKLVCLTKGFTKGFLQGLTQVKDLEIVGCNELMPLWKKEEGLLQHLTSLHRLRIKGCPKFVSLVGEEEGRQRQLGLPCRLENMEVESCIDLEKLEGFHGLTSLRRLKIEGCPRLVSFPETGFPSMLTELIIEECSALKSLHPAMTYCCEYRSLECLYISCCGSLTSIARSQLPLTLKKLEIRGCKNLQSVVEEEGSTSTTTSTSHNNSNNSRLSLLEHLSIVNCPSLRFISLSGELPTTLKHLDIRWCPKMESLVERFHNNTSLQHILMSYCESLKSLPDGLHNLINLSSIEIWECPGLVSFPDGGLPSTNLIDLVIVNWKKLEAMPHLMHNLTSLQRLRIEGCPNVLSFPEEGFPTSLTSLDIADVKLCKPLFEWGLYRLTSLRWLIIDGECLDVVSFPEENEKGMLILPTSLKALIIKDFPHMEYLSSKAFQKLISLEILGINKCPKLKSFPEEGLPPSLLQLWIFNCPLLKQGCKKNQGPDWPKISHIPYVQIDNKFIFDPDDVEQWILFDSRKNHNTKHSQMRNIISRQGTYHAQMDQRNSQELSLTMTSEIDLLRLL